MKLKEFKKKTDAWPKLDTTGLLQRIIEETDYR